MDDGKASEDLIQRMWDYIVTLEAANHALVDTLRQSVMVLEQFTESMPTSASWHDLIDLFKETLKAAERTVEAKSIH